MAGPTIWRRSRVAAGWIGRSRVAVGMAADTIGTTGVPGGCCPNRHKMSSCLEAGTVLVAYRAVAVLMRQVIGLRCTGCVVLVGCCRSVADFTDASRSGMADRVVTKAGHIVENNRLDYVGADVCGNRLDYPLYVVGRRTVTGGTDEFPICSPREAPRAILGAEIVAVVDKGGSRGNGGSRIGNGNPVNPEICRCAAAAPAIPF